ncbi:non-specific serine/threonine protein kinase [Ranunculus cassubicifolius]
MAPRNQTWLFHSFVFFLFYIVTDLSSATDTIYAGQSLTSKQTLISKGGTFELGFFTPGDSRKYYLGIWYKKVSVLQKTYVWVANREDPLHYESSFELKLSKDGNLALFNESRRAVWSTNTTTDAMDSSQAVLGDDGNFILRYGVTHFNVYWQSFDYPSETFLPGARMRYDKIAQKPQSLTSWKNANDPTPGLFSVDMDAIGDQFVLKWNRSETYWSSGPWNGKIFRDIPMMKLGYIFNYSYVKNVNESYFTYRLYNSSIICRYVLDVSGQIKQFSWDAKKKQWFLFWDVPIQQCEVFGFCGAYGVCDQNVLPFCKCMKGFRPRNQKEWDMSDFASSGCVRKSPLQCGAKDAFRTISNVNLPGKPEPFAASNLDQCKLACSKNCSCNAYAYRSLCLIWSGDLFSVQQFSGAYEGGGDLFLKLAAVDIEDTPAMNNTVLGSDISKGRNRGLKTWVIVGAVTGLVLLGLALICLQLKKRIRLSKKGKVFDHIL